MKKHINPDILNDFIMRYDLAPAQEIHDKLKPYVYQYSPKEIADSIGISIHTAYRWRKETAWSKISLENLIRLSAFAEINPFEVLEKK